MNYFIDFEATQFSNGIISVGCVSGAGDTFYSLVNTKHKITTFITHLTGITVADIEQAAPPEKVFEDLYDWVSRTMWGDKDAIPKFYCYGNCDKEFVKNNFKECNSFKAKAMLGYLYTDMKDYSGEVKLHFGLCKNIALKKVADYYRGEEQVQNHNSLEDALMLKLVWENIQKNEYEFNIFPEYMSQQFNQRINEEVPSVDEEKTTVYRFKGGELIETYPSLAAAVKWAYEQIPEGNERNKTSLKTIARKIKSAGKDPKKKYHNFKWKIN